MDRQGGDATVLQLFGQLDDDTMIGIPTEARLDGHRDTDRTDDSPRDLEHERHVAQHAGSGTFTRHLLDRTSEIDVEHIGPSGLANLCGLDHGLDIAAIDLYRNGAFFVAYPQLFFGATDTADERIARDKFSVHHICTEAFTHQSEGGIRDVFHRRLHDGPIT